MGRSIFWMALLLGAAVAVPYAADKWSKLKGGSDGKQTDSAKAPIFTAGVARPESANRVITSHPSSPRPSSIDLPVLDMDQAFRLDVTPATVMSRWPRVSNGLPD